MYQLKYLFFSLIITLPITAFSADQNDLVTLLTEDYNITIDKIFTANDP